MILGSGDMKASVQIDLSLEVRTLRVSVHEGKGVYVYSREIPLCLLASRLGPGLCV